MAFATDNFQVKPLWEFGPTPGKRYDFPGVSSHAMNPNITSHSQSPLTTGSSVIGLTFEDGVMIAADTLGSYGSLARYRDIERTLKVNDNIIVGAGGDYGDYQYLKDVINQKVIDDQCLDDGFKMKPRALHCWLTRVLYNRRSRFDPFWNNFIVAGLEDGVPFVGTVDKLGTAYVNDVLATGFGGHLAVPLLRAAKEKANGKPFTREEALTLLHNCMEVLFYRHTQALNKFEIAILSKSKGYELVKAKVKENWQVAPMIKGYL